MANEDKGKVQCPFCDGMAPVRRNKNGKLYFNCPTDGLVSPALGHFQAWLMEHATIYGPEGAPEPVEPPPPVETKKETPPPAPLPTPKPTEKKPAHGWGLL